MVSIVIEVGIDDGAEVNTMVKVSIMVDISVRVDIKVRVNNTRVVNMFKLNTVAEVDINAMASIIFIVDTEVEIGFTSTFNEV